MKLTQAVIDKGRIDTGGKADFIAWDDDLPGFGLRIREGGSRNYIIQYKIGGQQRRKTLGSTKEIQLDQARKLAKKDLGRVANGEDPQGEKNAARATAGETFGAIADRFVEYQKERLRPSSLDSTGLLLAATLQAPTCAQNRSDHPARDRIDAGDDCRRPRQGGR